MNFLKLQRRDGKNLQFMIKAKSKDEFDSRLLDCQRQGACVINQGVHIDSGYTLHWAVLKQER